MYPHIELKSLLRSKSIFINVSTIPDNIDIVEIGITNL
jgi:hypothetical protein